jgi:ABC-type Fe3+-hydroxamate transport system substrate-binding protein
MRATVADVQAKVRDLPKVRVYAYDSGEGPLYSYGRGLSSDLISMAGGKLIFADQPWFWEANIKTVAAPVHRGNDRQDVAPRGL